MNMLNSLVASAVLLASSAAFANHGNGGPLPSMRTDIRQAFAKAGYDTGKGSKLVVSPARPKFSGVGSSVQVKATLYNKSPFTGGPTSGQLKYRESGSGTFTVTELEEGPAVTGTPERDYR